MKRSMIYVRQSVQTEKYIRAIYGHNAVAENIVRKWFVKFRSRHFDLDDKEGPAGLYWLMSPSN